MESYYFHIFVKIKSINQYFSKYSINIKNKIANVHFNSKIHIKYLNFNNNILVIN